MEDSNFTVCQLDGWEEQFDDIDLAFICVLDEICAGNSIGLYSIWIIVNDELTDLVWSGMMGCKE